MVKSKITNLHKLLSYSLGNDFQIIDHQFELLTKPGEHYGSIMLALTVKIKRPYSKEETLELVAKLPPTNPLLQLVFDVPVTFKKEVFIYTQTIPTLVSFQKKFNIPENKYYDKLFPKCYGARISLDENNNTVDENAVIVLENLKCQGYKTEDRLVGFDLDVSKIIIRDLARFHAVPLAFKILNRQGFEEKVMPCLAKNKGLEQLSSDVGEAFHNSILEPANEIEELKPYYKKLEEIVMNGPQNLPANLPPPNESFGTMFHTDYWVSNTMLLRDENGKAVSNKMLDFQLMIYGSALRDLIFFMFTSIINSVLDKHFDDLIKLYYDSFIETLQDFNLDVSEYTWDYYMSEINTVAPSEVYHILMMLKPICTEKDSVKNTSEEFQESDWSRKDLLGPCHRRKLKDTVLALAKKNWL